MLRKYHLNLIRLISSQLLGSYPARQRRSKLRLGQVRDDGRRYPSEAQKSYTNLALSARFCKGTTFELVCQLGITDNTKMEKPLIVIDTNILVAGLRSKQGKSSQLLSMVGKNRFDIALSVPLLFEYEDVLKRPDRVPVSKQAVEDILDYLCQQASFQEIFYLWRPHLKDPKDDMVLELALNAKAQIIVTHNTKDFRNIAELGIEILTPAEFLEKLEKKSWQH